VVGGTVYIGSANGDVLAFPAVCRTPCAPKKIYETQAGLEVGTPVVTGSRIFVSADGEGGSFLYAFSRTCRIAVCRPLWYANTLSPYTFSTPAVSKGLVYIQGGRLYAFPVSCGSGGAVCKPRWKARAIGLAASPAVANGVVYAGSRTGRLYAFRARCGSGGATCKPLYRSGPTRGGGPFASSPAVAGGKVYYGAYTRVRAFGLKR
jgi:outer membrane protein assembly factor BamB